LDNKAIDIHSSVGRESFVIEISSLKDNFDEAIAKFIELMKDPNYTKEALTQIKYQKFGWIEQKKSDYSYISSKNLREVIFKGTPLARNYDGDKKSIESIKLKDIKDFIASHLGYNNLIVVAGGDIDFGLTKKYVAKIVKLLNKTDTKAIKPFKASNKSKTSILYEDSEQANIFFASPFEFSYKDKNQHLAKIAEYILGGGGFGSRMMEELRVKRGLTYGVYASLRRTKISSYLSGYIQTKIEKQFEAKELIQSVVDEFVQKGITQKELDDTKKFLLGSQPLRVETLSQRLNRAYSDFYYERELDFSQKELDNIEKTTLKEINEFIKSHKELSKLTFSIVTKKERKKDNKKD
jgi:predicted Zn-dependent peptidase